MQKLVSAILIMGVLISCGEPKKNDPKNEKQEVSKKETTSETLPSNDYSSLFINYECDMDVAEVAEALDILVSDVSLANYQRPGGCSFIVKGFGQNGLGDDTTIVWFFEKLGKDQVSKEIQTYLDDQANKEEVLGMNIDLSDTGDSYIVNRPMNGQVAVMNANYDSWLLLSYSPKHNYKSRTPEQHEELGGKMVVLANYLLKKHKK